jgi:hypothetical protein
MSDKTDEVLELERAVMDVLWKTPTLDSLEAFRAAFSDHLAKQCAYDEFQVELALRSLDRGDLDFPANLSFDPPTRQPVRVRA